MIQILFTPEEIELLKKEKDENPFPIVRRKACALYMRSQGFSRDDIAKAIGVSPATLTCYFKEYQIGGIEAIKRINYKGQKSKLHKFASEIIASLEKEPVRTLNETRARIFEISGEDLSIPQVKYFLSQHGIKRRKVKQILDRADVDEQDKFKVEKIEPLIEKAQKKEIHLFFVDAAHFVLMPFLGFLYSLTVRFVKASAGRQRYNVLGALNAITKEITTITNTTYINSHSVIALIDQLKILYVDLPIYLILDNARYQHNKFVIEYAEKVGVHLVFLPAYSPNLNLIERLWRFIKKESLYCKYYKDFESFKGAINQCLLDTKTKHKNSLNTLLTLKFQSMKKANINP